ncbi:peptidylprolyl isomerase [Curvibacter sp. HBC61]|uniref:peptidylprolyl isomerase n=1 Tax=Curvibacter cyanobacteriorum TaxID=3026422 RepID=A0ABT5MYD7_9BURK|nr:peptidylprolyl isomerase [Curvibacter sp. HBC61]MDD0839020.1 peptidylprolyl isomerase [Curvibacter sp. HBC61]
MTRLLTRLLSGLGILLVSALPLVASAQGPGIVIQRDGVAITTADLESELRRMSPEVRSAMLRNPDDMGRMSSNLLLRRVLAKQAEEAGLDKDMLNQATLRIVVDRVLSEMQLVRLDEKVKVNDQALTDRALSLYKANAKRFERPAEVRIRHILLANGSGTREQAEQLLADLKKGADFEKMAREKSNDPGSAAKGGDLGFFTAGRMVKSFEDAAFALKTPGELSGVVESQFGFHILQLVESRPAGMQSFEEVKAELKNEVLGKLTQDARLAEGRRILEKAQTKPEVLKAFIDAQLAAQPAQ